LTEEGIALISTNEAFSPQTAHDYTPADVASDESSTSMHRRAKRGVSISVGKSGVRVEAT
jgi:hypothetical protein